jgi:hypothetical protein
MLPDADVGVWAKGSIFPGTEQGNPRYANLKASEVFNARNFWLEWCFPGWDKMVREPRSDPGSPFSFGFSPKFLEDLSASHRQREQFFMLGKGFFEGVAVIYNDVIHAEAGFGKVTPVFTAENHYLVTVPMKFHIGLVYKLLLCHLATHLHHRFPGTSFHEKATIVPS